MQAKPYASAFDCVRKTFAEEGLNGFFRGMWMRKIDKPKSLFMCPLYSIGIGPPLVTVSIVKSLSFSVYETMKRHLRGERALDTLGFGSFTTLCAVSGGV